MNKLQQCCVNVLFVLSVVGAGVLGGSASPSKSDKCKWFSSAHVTKNKCLECWLVCSSSLLLAFA